MLMNSLHKTIKQVKDNWRKSKISDNLIKGYRKEKMPDIPRLFISTLLQIYFQYDYLLNKISKSKYFKVEYIF